MTFEGGGGMLISDIWRVYPYLSYLQEGDGGRSPCSICLDRVDLRNSGDNLRPCNHLACTGCIATILGTTRRCPTCRAAIHGVTRVKQQANGTYTVREVEVSAPRSGGNTTIPSRTAPAPSSGGRGRETSSRDIALNLIVKEENALVSKLESTTRAIETTEEQIRKAQRRREEGIAKKEGIRTRLQQVRENKRRFLQEQQ